MAEIRFCKDIGMFALDRPRSSCKHATPFCVKTCFNVKLERAFNHAIKPKDIRNEAYWKQVDGDKIAKVLSKKRKSVERFRFMTRGEAFSDAKDIKKVKDILVKNTETLFWIPTRAWRNHKLRGLIELEILPLPNARVQASLDPSNTEAGVQEVIERGWSTIFYGDDNEIDGRYLCQKTHYHQVGACMSCKFGCFSSKQVHVHLKQH